MNTPEWMKPALLGAAGGAVALAVVGFGWGGWMTGGNAETLVLKESKSAVVASLVPICIAQSNADPEALTVLASLEEESVYKRRDALMATGWATMPGAAEPDRNVAEACMKELAKQF